LEDGSAGLVIVGPITTILQIASDLKKAESGQPVLEGVTAGLLVFGPTAAIERILSSMDRSVKWNLPIDDAVSNELQAALSELQRAMQAAMSEDESA
jgi:nitrogen fixation/metabolism regulation signal transduction histidine kinase